MNYALVHHNNIYHILSKTSSPTVTRNIRHLVAIRIGMNKMAEGDEYLDYRAETLEQMAKPWSVSLGAFLRRNGGFELTVWTAVRG